jgi:hypothetical protein
LKICGLDDLRELTGLSPTTRPTFLPMTPNGRSLKMILSQKEPIMARHIPLTFSTILLGLVGTSTYLLCSTDLLHNATFFLLH